MSAVSLSCVELTSLVVFVGRVIWVFPKQDALFFVASFGHDQIIIIIFLIVCVVPSVKMLSCERKTSGKGV